MKMKIKGKDEDIGFIVITEASNVPNDNVGNWCDSFGVIGKDEDGLCLFIDGEVSSFKKGDKRILCPFISHINITHNGKTFTINRLRTTVFTKGEILIVDKITGREINGGRKPSKWYVEYEIFDNIKDAIIRSSELSNISW